MKFIKSIIFYFFMNISIYAINGAGYLDITVDLIPYGSTKIYSKINKTILDAGVFNSESLTLDNRKLATVRVFMNPKQNGELNGRFPCALEGGFNGLYKLDELESKVNNLKIELVNLTKYNKSEGISSLELITSNFKILNKKIENEDYIDDTYNFSAYPRDCNEAYNAKNLITRLEYQFDLILSINGEIRKGDIVRGDLSLDNIIVKGAGKGALKDLITTQLNSIYDGDVNISPVR